MFRVISTFSATLVSSSPDVKLGSLTLIRHKMTLSHFSKGLIRPVSGGQSRDDEDGNEDDNEDVDEEG